MAGCWTLAPIIPALTAVTEHEHRHQPRDRWHWQGGFNGTIYKVQQYFRIGDVYCIGINEIRLDERLVLV